MAVTQKRRHAVAGSSLTKSPNRSHADEMLTIKEMCALMKVSQRTFYRWKAAGDVPELFWVGGTLRAYVADYRAWLQLRPTGSRGC